MTFGTTRESLGAYYGDHRQKAQIINQLTQMADMGRFDAETYWDESERKGCAIGGVLGSLAIKDCLVSLSKFERTVNFEFNQKTNIPPKLARLMEDIFTYPQVGTKDSKFPAAFMSAIPVGFKEWDELYLAVCTMIMGEIARVLPGHLMYFRSGSRGRDKLDVMMEKMGRRRFPTSKEISLLHKRPSSRIHEINGDLDVKGLHMGMTPEQMVARLLKSYSRPEDFVIKLVRYYGIVSFYGDMDRFAFLVVNAMLTKLQPEIAAKIPSIDRKPQTCPQAIKSAQKEVIAH